MDRCIWCCRAATVPSRARARIIATLPHFLFPKDQPFFADTPDLLQTLLQTLVSLVIDLSSQADTTSDVKQISGYITIIRGKGFGKLSRSAVEKEYGVRFGKEDRDSEVRDAVIAESIVKCLEVGHENRRRWILHHLLEVCIRRVIIVNLVERVFRSTGLHRNLVWASPLCLRVSTGESSRRSSHPRFCCSQLRSKTGVPTERSSFVYFGLVFFLRWRPCGQTMQPKFKPRLRGLSSSCCVFKRATSENMFSCISAIGIRTRRIGGITYIPCWRNS